MDIKKHKTEIFNKIKSSEFNNEENPVFLQQHFSNMFAALEQAESHYRSVSTTGTKSLATSLRQSSEKNLSDVSGKLSEMKSLIHSNSPILNNITDPTQKAEFKEALGNLNQEIEGRITLYKSAKIETQVPNRKLNQSAVTHSEKLKVDGKL